MRNLYRRWAQFMEADSWDELASWRHPDKKAERLQRTDSVEKANF
jgi:hypothetical protein